MCILTISLPQSVVRLISNDQISFSLCPYVVTDADGRVGCWEGEVTGEASLADGLEPADHPVSGGADPDAAGRPGGHPEWDESYPVGVWRIQGKQRRRI